MRAARVVIEAWIGYDPAAFGDDDNFMDRLRTALVDCEALNYSVDIDGPEGSTYGEVRVIDVEFAD